MKHNIRLIIMCWVVQLCPTILTNAAPIPNSDSAYCIVEGKGILDVVMLGDSRQQVIEKLGKPKKYSFWDVRGVNESGCGYKRWELKVTRNKYYFQYDDLPLEIYFCGGTVSKIVISMFPEFPGFVTKKGIRFGDTYSQINSCYRNASTAEEQDIFDTFVEVNKEFFEHPINRYIVFPITGTEFVLTYGHITEIIISR